MSSSSTNTNSNPRAVDDLIHMIDHHLAFNLSHDDHSLRSQVSNGTMFVDYDGTDVPVVSFRHTTHRSGTSFATLGAGSDPRRDSVFDSPSESRSSDARSPSRPAVWAPSPPSIVTSEGLNVRRNYGARGGVFIEGVDRATGLEYGYDGRTVHVHRDGRSCSGVLEYVEMDAGAYVRGLEFQKLELEKKRKYQHRHHEYNAHSSCRRRHRHRHANNGNVPFKVLDVDKELPPPPTEGEMSKREKAAAFLAKVLEKLACLGLLEHLDRRREYGHRHRRRVRSTPPPVPKIPEKWRR